MSVWADTKTVRDKNGRDKRAPTIQAQVNSVNEGFKVTKLLTMMNVFDFFPLEVRDSQDKYHRILSENLHLIF